MTGLIIFRAITDRDVKRELKNLGITPTKNIIHELMEHLEIMSKLEIDDGTREEWISEIISEALEEMEFEDRGATKFEDRGVTEFDDDEEE